MIEFGKTPVDKPQLSFLVVDHNVMRLDIAMHYAFAVTKIKGLVLFLA
jgi:hypothetical protein